MGRLGLAGDGMGARDEEPRLLVGVARVRRAMRAVSGQLCGARVQLPSGDQFHVWGWRIPFLISIIMVGVGMWIRLGISETPVFQRMIAEERVERVPVLEVLKRQPKQVILSALLRLPEQGPGFIVGTFIFTYATTVLGQSRNFVLMGVIAQTFIGFIWVVCAGAMSDHIGRKNMYMLGAAFMGIFGFIYFEMLNTGIP
jgi:MFS family permease